MTTSITCLHLTLIRRMLRSVTGTLMARVGGMQLVATTGASSQVLALELAHADDVSGSSGEPLTGAMSATSSEWPEWEVSEDVLSEIGAMWVNALDRGPDPVGLGREHCQVCTLLPPDVVIDLSVPRVTDAIKSFMAAPEGVLHMTPDLDAVDAAAVPLPDEVLVLSGSFNPLHTGHRALLNAAREVYLARDGAPTQVWAGYELALVNADKAPISSRAVLERLTRFAGRTSVLLTTAPRFDQKAALLAPSRVTFVVGVDTAVRILNPKYYGGSQAGLLDAMLSLASSGVSFIVAGRVDDDSGEFISAATITDPVSHPVVADLEAAGHPELFLPIPDDVFRVDLSSSAIRAARQL